MPTNLPWRTRAPRLLAILLAMILASPPLHAAEVILQNDSIPPGTALPTFNSGDRVAGWFTIPMSGDIVGVQFLWGSMFGGAPASIETAITISTGTFPTPGAVLGTIATPSLIDQVAPNEFRFFDPPTNLNPIKIPVTAGQVIAVDLEFFNTNFGFPLFPSLEIDGAIQPGVSSVFAGGMWADASLLGVTGDFGIRAILDPIPEPTGALLCLLGLGAFLVRRRRTTLS